MTSDPAHDAALALLSGLGAADVPHPGGTLLDHLIRVHDLLASWGAGPVVRLAGLCHAAYGTDGFDVALLPITDRGRLVEAVGVDVEATVFRYGGCDRARTYPHLGEPEVEFTDRFTGAVSRPGSSAVARFVEISAANELDVVRHNPAIAERAGDRLLALMVRAERHLSPAARAAWSGWDRDRR